MESPTPVSRNIPPNSKKRVFPGGSSSSGCNKEVEVLETINLSTAKPKQKEVICPEIIDIDMEDDSDDVTPIDREVGRSGKGKEALSNFSAGHGSLANGGSGSEIQMPNNGTADDPLYYGEDEWIDTYYDDIIFDDYLNLDSQFDHMDIPPGVEVPFPWLPSSLNDTQATTTSTSTSSSHLQQDPINLLSSSKCFEPQKKSSPSSTNPHLSSQSSKSGKEPLPPFGKSNKKSPSLYTYSSPHNQPPFGSSNSSNVHIQGNYPTLNMLLNAPGVGTPMWKDLPPNVLEPSTGVIMNENYSASAQVETRNVDEILQHFEHFKKFDIVEDCTDHHYCTYGSAGRQPPKIWAKTIQDEWKILEKDLPDTIFVRVYESRMDLLRAVIVGAEGTPYHDGLFFFDVFFPITYPNCPPQVYYHSGGLRINPNLYNCGKVCLSLLNTWTGYDKEKWVPGLSTMLQVLVSIQGLILNAKPYFNEPGYANMSGSVSGEKSSLDYNEKTFIYSLQTMVYNMRRPPKHFKDFVVGHFCKHARDILVSCKAYLDGAQVGCLVKGGVQDVDEGDKSCSLLFKNNLANFITTLVNSFSQIGAKDCQEFLPLAQKATGPPSARYPYPGY